MENKHSFFEQFIDDVLCLNDMLLFEGGDLDILNELASKVNSFALWCITKHPSIIEEYDYSNRF